VVEIIAVAPLAGYWLRLTLSSGDVVERDVSALLHGAVFEPVRANRDVFDAAFVDAGTVTWPGNVDIAPETLIWNGSMPVSPGARPETRLRLSPPADR
jgi:hypothetical protein